MSDKEIIEYCRLITHWTNLTGQSDMWKENDLITKKMFYKSKKELKRWIDELKKGIVK